MNRTWVAIIGAIVFMGIGSIITLILVGKLDVKLKSIDVNLYETLTIIIQTLLFSVGFWTLRAALIASKTQHKQWLNDSFIKHEANLLLEFKDKTNNLYEVINFIKQFYMPIQFAFSPIQLEAKKARKEKGADFDKLKFVDNFNYLCELNDFYNKNQGVLKKHNLDEGMSALVFFLKVLEHVDIKYLNYELVFESNELLVFKFERWPTIIDGFCFSAKIEIDGFDFKNIENNTLDYSEMDLDQRTKYHEEIAKKYLNDLTNKIYKLVNEISNKTTYFDDKSESQRTSGRQFRYFRKITI